MSKNLPKTISRRAFTLLEVMVGLTLLLVAGAWTVHRLHGAIGKKKFSSEIEALRERVAVCRKLSATMQADWKGVLRRDGGGWVLEASCQSGLKLKELRRLKFSTFAEVLLDGKSQEILSLDFFSGGLVFPDKEVLISSKNGQKERVLSAYSCDLKSSSGKEAL